MWWEGMEDWVPLHECRHALPGWATVTRVTVQASTAPSSPPFAAVESTRSAPFSPPTPPMLTASPTVAAAAAAAAADEMTHLLGCKKLYSPCSQVQTVTKHRRRQLDLASPPSAASASRQYLVQKPPADEQWQYTDTHEPMNHQHLHSKSVGRAEQLPSHTKQEAQHRALHAARTRARHGRRVPSRKRSMCRFTQKSRAESVYPSTPQQQVKVAVRASLGMHSTADGMEQEQSKPAQHSRHELVELQTHKTHVQGLDQRQNSNSELELAQEQRAAHWPCVRMQAAVRGYLTRRRLVAAKLETASEPRELTARICTKNGSPSRLPNMLAKQDEHPLSATMIADTQVTTSIVDELQTNDLSDATAQVVSHTPQMTLHTCHKDRASKVQPPLEVSEVSHNTEAYSTPARQRLEETLGQYTALHHQILR